jgi:hypothetical protein
VFPGGSRWPNGTVAGSASVARMADPSPSQVDPLRVLGELPGVADAVTGARAAVDTLLGHRVLRRRSAEVSAEAALRCARASAALDGADVPLETVRAGTPDPAVQGALRVSTELGSLLDTVERAPLQALARLHVLAARGRVPDEELGRPRQAPGVAARLAALAELMARRDGGSALLLAAVVHGELLTLPAFGTGAGVVARGAARLVLVCRGLDPKAVTVPDAGHWERRAEYEGAARAYASGEVRPWLLHCAEALRWGATEALAICTAVERGEEGGHGAG